MCAPVSHVQNGSAADYTTFASSGMVKLRRWAASEVFGEYNPRPEDVRMTWRDVALRDNDTALRLGMRGGDIVYVDFDS